MRQSLPHLLVETKLNRPAIGAKSILRPRLISLLNEAMSKRLTLISAPAGYGKTTLAAQWLAQDRQLAAWLSLDPCDSDTERFLRYVLAAIQLVAPGFGEGIAPLLTAPTLPPLEYLADTLISDLSVIDKPFSLILDDYHNIASDSVQTILIRMIQYLPANLHMVVITRSDPPWPLDLWRVREWLNEMRAAHLRFSREEARAFLNSDRKKNVPDSAADILQHMTEGWAAGLQMAQISISHADDPEALARAFSSSHGLIVDFLMDEVISRQPPEVLDFFAVTSILDRFCASLCDHLLLDESDSLDGRRLIALLEKENLFLVPLDTEGTWYRYHHLFQNMLIHHIRVNLPQERKDRFHQLAAEWFAEQGMIEEALRHFLAAGNLDSAAELFALNLHHLVQNDLSRRTLMRYLRFFPSGAEKEQPALLVAHACYKIYHWDFPGILSLLDTVEDLLRRPGCSIAESVRQLLLANIDAMRGFYLYWQGDMANSLRHAQRALHCVPKEHHWAYTLAILYTAASLSATGRREEALRLLSDKVSEDCSAGSLNVGTILAAKAAIHCYEGNLDAVREVAHRVLESHKTVPVPDYWLSHSYYFLGSVAYERNLLLSAAEYFGRVEQMIYRVNTPMYRECLIGLALTAWAGKAWEKAWEYARKARSFAVTMNDATSLQISDSLYTRLTIFAGKTPAEPATFPISDDANKFWLEIPSLTQAEYLIKRAPQDCSSTILLIDKALKQAKDCHNSRQVIQFLSVKAVALKCAGKFNQAFETLEETLRMAEPHGFLRTFVDRGPVMAELLRDLSAKRSESPYIRSLLNAFGDKLPTETTAAPSEDHRSHAEQSTDAFIANQLSRRELDILTLLEKRLTDKEIAKRMFISHHTVKKHTTNIYRKMKVTGRRQAVAAAKKAGILHPK